MVRVGARAFGCWYMHFTLHQKDRRDDFGYDLKSSQDFDGTKSISKFSKFKYLSPGTKINQSPPLVQCGIKVQCFSWAGKVIVWCAHGSYSPLPSCHLQIWLWAMWERQVMRAFLMYSILLLIIKLHWTLYWKEIIIAILFVHVVIQQYFIILSSLCVRLYGARN